MQYKHEIKKLPETPKLLPNKYKIINTINGDSIVIGKQNQLAFSINNTILFLPNISLITTIFFIKISNIYLINTKY
jgi:hypothetical protein